MGYRTVADIRNSWGATWSDASDEEVLGAYAKATKRAPAEVADAFGYDPGKGSLTNERLSSSADNYQSNMYGLGSAVANSVGLNRVGKWMGRQSEDNKFQADIASARARELGGIDSFRDVTGLRSGANFLGGIAASSFPYLAETATYAGANALTGGALTPAILARAASAAPKLIGGGGLAAGASFAERRAALAAGQRLAGVTMAAGVASYPSAVADVLANQREQLEANGQDPSNVRLGPAMLGGVPYVALNLLSPAQRIAAGVTPKRLVGSLDRVGSTTARGFGLGAGRLATNAGIAGVQEGANELGQEFVNQRFGRMAVDPNQKFYDDSVDAEGNPTKYNSSNRFAESFVGGLALGGTVGGAAGGWRRSSGYKPAESAESGQTTDLMAPPAVDPDEYAANYGTPYAPVTGGLAPRSRAPDPDIVGFGQDDANYAYDEPSPYDAPRSSPTPTANMPSFRMEMGDDGTMQKVPRPGYPGQFIQDDPSPAFPYATQGSPDPRVVAQDNAGLGGVDQAGADVLYGENDGDPGLAEARRRYLESRDQQKLAAEQAEAAQAAAQERAALGQRAANVGLDSKKGAHVQLMGVLEKAQAEGLLTNTEVGTLAGSVASGASPGTVGAKLETIRNALKAEGSQEVAPGTAGAVKAAILAGSDGKAELKAAQKLVKDAAAAQQKLDKKAAAAKPATPAAPVAQDPVQEVVPVTPPPVVREAPVPTQVETLEQAANVLLAPDKPAAPAPAAPTPVAKPIKALTPYQEKRALKAADEAKKVTLPNGKKVHLQVLGGRGGLTAVNTLTHPDPEIQASLNAVADQLQKVNGKGSDRLVIARGPDGSVKAMKESQWDIFRLVSGYDKDGYLNNEPMTGDEIAEFQAGNLPALLQDAVEVRDKMVLERADLLQKMAKSKPSSGAVTSDEKAVKVYESVIERYENQVQAREQEIARLETLIEQQGRPAGVVPGPVKPNARSAISKVLNNNLGLSADSIRAAVATDGLNSEPENLAFDYNDDGTATAVAATTRDAVESEVSNKQENELDAADTAVTDELEDDAVLRRLPPILRAEIEDVTNASKDWDKERDELSQPEWKKLDLGEKAAWVGKFVASTRMGYDDSQKADFLTEAQQKVTNGYNNRINSSAKAGAPSAAIPGAVGRNEPAGAIENNGAGQQPRISGVGGQGNSRPGSQVSDVTDVAPREQSQVRKLGSSGPVAVSVKNSNGAALDIPDAHSFLARIDAKIKKLEDLSACLR